MKKATDPRHKKRRQVIKELFAASYTKQKFSQKAQTILAEKEKLDGIVMEHAPAWPVEKLNRVDLAILRLAIFELQEKREPVKVIIDEAVELAKEFGSEGSPAFVNGVLGAIVKKEPYGQAAS